MFKKNQKKILRISLLSYFFLNSYTFASSDFSAFIHNLGDKLITPIIKLSFALAALFFFWGVFEFITNVDDPTKRKEGKTRVIYSLISLFVMFAIWGIVVALKNSFGLSSSGAIHLYQI